ncbi:alpha/beta fold hydrolase [Aliikangiella marina]|nr:alpha/beta fold hydrolase [Aliikangiella marina]
MLSEFTLLLAHGAGADKDSEWMVNFSLAVEALGIKVVRFNFPYMDKSVKDGKRRPPDRMPKLQEAFIAQIEKLSLDARHIIIGGKSMGGRVASLIAAEPDRQSVAGVVCLGFPFTPPGKPEQFRGEHLKSIQVPTLIIQGERDKFGGHEQVEQYEFSEQVSYVILQDGDHSFVPRVRSGVTLQENIQRAVKSIGKFIETSVAS